MQNCRNLWRCWGLILTGVMMAAAAAESPPMSLLQALALAYQTNPRLLAARRQLNQVDEGVPQALAGWRPSVSVTASAGGALFDQNTDSMHDPERRAPQDYVLQLHQPLYTSGQVDAQVEQAKARVRAQRANLRASEQDVLLAAGQAFLDVVRDRAVLALNRNQVAVQERTLRASTVELAAGGLSAADLGQARARLATATAQRAAAEAALHQSEAAFLRQVGEAAGRLTAPDLHIALPDTKERTVALAAEDNPDVAAAREALDAARHGIDIERAGLLPHLAFNGRLERVRDTDIQMLNQRDNVLQGTLDLTVPIYQGGGEYSRIRQAKEASFRLENLVEEAMRQARQLASSAWDVLAASRTRAAAQRDAAAGNEAAVRGFTQQQQVGARTLLDVLIAQQDLLTSQVAAVTADHDVLLAMLQLGSAIGRLDAEPLHLATPVYDPAAHYKKVRDKWIGTTPP